MTTPLNTQLAASTTPLVSTATPTPTTKTTSTTSTTTSTRNTNFPFERIAAKPLASGCSQYDSITNQVKEREKLVSDACGSGQTTDFCNTAQRNLIASKDYLFQLTKECKCSQFQQYKEKSVLLESLAKQKCDSLPFGESCQLAQTDAYKYKTLVEQLTLACSETVPCDRFGFFMNRAKDTADKAKQDCLVYNVYLHDRMAYAWNSYL